MRIPFRISLVLSDAGGFDFDLWQPKLFTLSSHFRLFVSGSRRVERKIQNAHKNWKVSHLFRAVAVCCFFIEQSDFVFKIKSGMLVKV